MTPNDKVPFAILSVGGFLGMGTKLVVVPSSLLKVVGKDMILPGTTKRVAEGISGVQVRIVTSLVRYEYLTEQNSRWMSHGVHLRA